MNKKVTIEELFTKIKDYFDIDFTKKRLIEAFKKEPEALEQLKIETGKQNQIESEEELYELIMKFLNKKGVSESHSMFFVFESTMPYNYSALAIAHYFENLPFIEEIDFFNKELILDVKGQIFIDQEGMYIEENEEILSLPFFQYNLEEEMKNIGKKEIEINTNISFIKRIFDVGIQRKRGD